MANASVKEFSKYWWSEVYNRIIGAAIFLDVASAECLHWNGGLSNLLSGGAVAVKTLSPFEFANKEHKKAVFITQTTSTQLRTIRDIIRNSNFSHCILISVVSLDIVYLELNEGRDVADVVSAGRAATEASKQLEAMLLEWIDRKQSAVEIVHIPIFTISPTSSIFLTPPHCKVYPSFDGKLVPDTPNVDLYTLTNDERSQARRLASNLNSMFDSMNIKEDVFYMGTYSSIIAGILDNSPVCLARRKNCSNAASLVLVDCTLDLSGVTSHSSECVLDKIMSVLPTFPGHSTDVAVDMSALCEANVLSVTDDVQLSPGCLYHAEDESCIQSFEHMINKSQKEVMFDLYNKLSKIDVLKSPGPKTLLKVTPQSIEKVVSACKGDYEVIEKHSGLLQQSLAMLQTLKSPLHSQVDLIMSLEKQVLQNLATSRESTSVLNQIGHLIRTRKSRSLSLDRLLALLIHVYSLAGSEVTFPRSHEEALAETLSVAVFEDHKSMLAAEEACFTNIVTPEQCGVIANGIVSRLKNIASMRDNLVKYKSVLRRCEGGAGQEYCGLLQQLMEDLVDPARPDLPDLRHKNEGIKDLLRSGLNILTSKKSRVHKHPMSSPLVIVFVVGGVTAETCTRLQRRLLSSGGDARLLLGATKMAAAPGAARDALAL